MGSGGVRPGAGRPGGSGKGKHIFYITTTEKVELQAFLANMRARADNATVKPTAAAAPPIGTGTMPTDANFEQNRKDLQKALLRGAIEEIERIDKTFLVKTR